MSYKIDRNTYAQTYGPTTGDRVRLADTELFIEVEKDLTTFGDEVKFGGGKVIRDGMGQSQVRRSDGAVDTVITNALIIDWRESFPNPHEASIHMHLLRPDQLDFSHLLSFLFQKNLNSWEMLLQIEAFLQYEKNQEYK